MDSDEMSGILTPDFYELVLYYIMYAFILTYIKIINISLPTK